MINSKDFFIALDLLEKEKKINKEYFIESLEAALASAYKKMFGEAKSAMVKVNAEKNTIKVYAYKTVVAEVEDPDKQISLEEARELKASYNLGDIIMEEVTPKSFGRIAAQTAKQVVMQRLREAERAMVSSELSDKGDTLTTGIIRRIENNVAYLEVGGIDVEGVMNEGDQIPNERYKEGDRLRIYVKRVKETSYGPQVQVSRSNLGFVKKLFELEIPEIESGEIVIKNIVREAGYRTKIAVYTENAQLDPVGACIGNKGARVNAIIAELNGEKIDIVPYSEDAFEFIAAALSPAKVMSVEINETAKTSRVVVPDDKLSLAIGKDGQNVRLAARLTGWKIDVKPASKSDIAETPAPAEADKPADNTAIGSSLEDTTLFEDLE
ncbi:MAG: transcription termination factor NusA [Firmicutes bacterium]|nr:transcription termination factor NusA [Bacillota bacterium]